MSNNLDHAFLSIASMAQPPSDFGAGAPIGLPAARPPAHSVPSGFEPHVLASLLNEISVGILMVSPSGQVLYSNLASRDAMASSGLLSVQSEQLFAASPADHNALLLALANASKGVSGLLRLSVGGASLTLSVVPAASAATSGIPGIQAITLFFPRSAICDTSVFLLFARSFGLTPTEQQVLTFLCRSLATPEIAGQLNVAVSTIRSHVRSLCYKTRSKGARELINRIAMLPPAGYSTRLHMH